MRLVAEQRKQDRHLTDTDLDVVCVQRIDCDGWRSLKRSHIMHRQFP